MIPIVLALMLLTTTATVAEANPCNPGFTMKCKFVKSLFGTWNMRCECERN